MSRLPTRTSQLSGTLEPGSCGARPFGRTLGRK
jgi:hypothetical protein